MPSISESERETLWKFLVKSSFHFHVSDGGLDGSTSVDEAQLLPFSISFVLLTSNRTREIWRERTGWTAENETRLKIVVALRSSMQKIVQVQQIMTKETRQ